jgi:Tol biopolymer transport system component
VAATTTTELVPIALAPGDPWIVYMAPVDERNDGVGSRLVRPDGSDDHRATPQVPISKGGQQAHADWSPDGSLLAFAVDDATDDSKPPELLTRDLWISQPDGTGAERVLDCVLPCVEVDYPAWSPDGSKIAFKEFGENDGVAAFSLRSMDVETRVVTTLVTAAGTDRLREPRWSPDGQRIVLELSHWTVGGELTETAIAVVDLRDPVPAPRVITGWSLWATSPDWHPTEDLISVLDPTVGAARQRAVQSVHRSTRRVRHHAADRIRRW